jgi:anaerobic selenocysteine-containing dehydrogenase
MVSFDIYLNETTRHADLILPPATGLETPHYDFTFHNLAIRNSSKYSPALFDKSNGAKYDWEIFQELGNVLSEKVTGQKHNEGQLLIPEQMLAKSLSYGPYNFDFEELKNAPHGIYLGPLKSQLPGRLVNENKKINIAPALLVKDITRLLEDDINKKGYLLIGKRHLRDNNSWMHNSELLQKGKNRCLLFINPIDAAKENISNDELIEVSSRVGKVKIPISITEDMMPGVLAMPHGYGHNKSGIRLNIASKKAGVSVNDLTDDHIIDELTGNSAFSNVYVTLQKL